MRYLLLYIIMLGVPSVNSNNIQRPFPQMPEQQTCLCYVFVPRAGSEDLLKITEMPLYLSKEPMLLGGDVWYPFRFGNTIEFRYALDTSAVLSDYIDSIGTTYFLRLNNNVVEFRDAIGVPPGFTVNSPLRLFDFNNPEQKTELLAVPYLRYHLLEKNSIIYDYALKDTLHLYDLKGFEQVYKNKTNHSDSSSNQYLIGQTAASVAPLFEKLVVGERYGVLYFEYTFDGAVYRCQSANR